VLIAGVAGDYSRMNQGEPQDPNASADDVPASGPVPVSPDDPESHSQYLDETYLSDTPRQRTENQLSEADFIGPDDQSSGSLQQVGRYTLNELLGKGGFGSVFLGHDPQLNRRVAIKVPHLHMVASHVEDEFLKEARQLAQLNHPGIVTVFDVGVDNGRCFIVSDYLDGQPLGARLRESRFAWQESARISADIADALAHAHAQRTVHRDLKPGNVILVSSPQGPRPVLVDFGLAVSDAQRAAGSRRGEVSGTPNYMTPEQVRGAGHRIDGRTDIYALGVILYRMLTGRLPFVADNVTELLRQVSEDEAQPPRQTAPEIPPELERICLKAMARRLADRYTTATDMAVELRELLTPSASGAVSGGPHGAASWAGITAQQAGYGQPAPQSHQSVPVPPQPASLSPAPESAVTSVSATTEPVAHEDMPNTMSLPAVAEPEPPSEFSRSLIRRGAERRRVTLIQCGSDLYESEDIQASLDTDEQSELLHEYQELCRSVCLESGGTVVQETDTGLLLCFGYPTTYEDAVYRAVRTGRRAIDELAAFNTRQQKQRGVSLFGQIAIHSDFAILEEKGQRGDTLSLVGAVRHVVNSLEGIGDPNTVIISVATHKLVKGSFDCESLGLQRIKGVAGGTEVFVVTGEKSRNTLVDETDANELTPLIGRDREVGLMQERWEQAAEGMGQVVLLIGEAGLGKSRLVHALKKHVTELSDEDASPVIEWRTTAQHKSSSLYAASNCFELALGFEAGQSDDDKLDRLEEYLRKWDLDGDQELSLFASLLSIPSERRYAPLDLSPQLKKQKTFELLLDWLKECAGRQPVLFVVEDLHWIDPTSLQFIELLVDQGLNDSVLTLLTFRPEFETPWKSKAHQTSVALNRLTKRQIGEMMAAKLSVENLPQPVVDQIADRTDGVPLFVEEFSNMLLESGMIDRISNFDPESSASMSQLEIPATLQDLLMAKLDRIASNMEVVQLGAAIGREFSYELLKSVSKLDDGDLAAEVQKLVEAELLFERGRGNRVRYQFKHALIQDAAYGSLVKKRRQQFHQQIAEALEEAFAEVRDRQPELLAHHFDAAGDVPKGVEYWLLAGRRANQQSANAEAIAHLSQGLELLDRLDEGPDRDRFELDLRLALAVPLTATKGYVAAEVEAEYVRARDLARKADNIEGLLPVLHGLYRYYVVQADNQQARQLGEEILETAEQLGDPEHIMEAHRSLSLTLSFIGEFDKVLHHVRAGLATYDTEAHADHKFVYGADPGMIFMSFEAWALWHQGFPDQAYQTVQKAFAHTEAIRHPHSRAFCLSFNCGTLAFLGLWDECRQAAEEAIEISTKHGFPFWLGKGTVMKGACLIKTGSPDEGIKQISGSLEKFNQAGVGMWRPFHLALLAEGYHLTGRTDEALKQIAAALEIADRQRGDSHAADLHRLLGEWTLLQDESATAAAERHFQQAIQIAQQQSSRSMQLRAMTSLARLWHRQDRTQEARMMLQLLYSTFTEGLETPDLQAARETLDLLG